MRVTLLLLLLLASSAAATDWTEIQTAARQMRYEQALRLLDGLAPTTKTDETLQALNRGVILDQLGDQSRALLSVSRAYDLALKHSQPTLLAEASTWLATYHIRQQRWKQADRYLNQSRKLYQRLQDPSGLTRLRLLKANLHYAQGRDETADRGYREVLDKATRASLKVAAFSGLGNLAIRQGRFDEAEVFYQKALTALPADRPLQAGSVLLNTAGLLLERGEYERSLACLKQAETTLKASPVGRARVLLQRGLLFMRLGDFSRAENLMREAGLLVRRQKVAMPAEWQVGLRLNRAAIMRLSGKPEAARKLLESTSRQFEVRGNQAVELWLELAHLSTGQSKEEALKRVSALLEVYPDPVGQSWALVAQGELGLERKDLDAAQAAFERGAQLSQENDLIQVFWRTLFGQGRVARLRGQKEAALAHYFRALETLEAVSGELTSRELRSGFASDKLPFYFEVIDLLLEMDRPQEAFLVSERARARSLVEIVRRGGLPAASTAEPQALEELQQALPEGSRLLSILVGEDHSLVFSLERQLFSVHRCELGRQGLTDLVTAARPKTSSREAAEKLYRLLLGPAVNPEQPAQRLIIIPDGPLHYLPFAALVQGDLYLIEQRPLSLAYSANVWAHSHPGQVGEGVLVYAAPDLKGADGAAPTRGGDHPVKLRHSDFSPLPGARQEALAVAALHPQSQVRLAEECRESLLEKELSRPVATLHFATHGFANDTNPMLGGLLMTPEPGHDGFLLARDIYRRQLHCRRAVLSACETALGQVAGGEGMIGLTHAFRTAGVQQVVASLWPVADEHTRHLMERFHRSLATGQATSQALREAQLRSIAEGHEPSKWAAFVVIGKD